MPPLKLLLLSLEGAWKAPGWEAGALGPGDPLCELGQETVPLWNL